MEQNLKYWCSHGYLGDPSNDPPVPIWVLKNSQKKCQKKFREINLFEQRCIVLCNYNQRICDSKLHFFFKFRVICVCIYGPNNIGIAGECLEKAFDTSSVISLVIFGFTLLGMSTPRPSVQSYSYGCWSILMSGQAYESYF